MTAKEAWEEAARICESLFDLGGSALDAAHDIRARAAQEGSGWVAVIKRLLQLGYYPVSGEIISKDSDGAQFVNGQWYVPRRGRNTFQHVVDEFDEPLPSPPSAAHTEPVEQLWAGCNECDISFNCYDGRARCIRLPTELATQQAEPSQRHKSVLGNTAPAALVGMPEMPRTIFITFDKGFLTEWSGDMVTKADYDALRAHAEQLQRRINNQAGWLNDQQRDIERLQRELMIRTDNYEYQRQRADALQRKLDALQKPGHVWVRIDGIKSQDDALAALQDALAAAKGKE